MVIVIEKSRRNRFVRILSAALILVAGIVLTGIIDNLYGANKPLFLLFAFIVFLPLWLFSVSHTGYFFTQKQNFEVLDGRIRITGRGTVEEIPFSKLDSILIKKENKFIVLSISYGEQEKNFNLQYKWYLRDLMNQSFLRQNFERILSTFKNIKALDDKILIDSSIATGTENSFV